MFTLPESEPFVGEHAAPSITTRISNAVSAFNEPKAGEHSRAVEEYQEVSDDTLSIFDAPAREFDTDEFGISEHMAKRTFHARYVALPAAAVLLAVLLGVSTMRITSSITVETTEEEAVTTTAVYDEEDEEEIAQIATDATDAEEEVVVDASDGNVYLVVGQDIAAGTWRLNSTSTSDSLKSYFAVYTDEDKSELLANDAFTGVSYVTVEDGQYMRVSQVKITAVTDGTAAASTDSTESGYLVGVDVEAGTHVLVKADSDETYANYVLWSSTDAATHTIVASGDFESTLELTLSEGQLLSLEGAVIQVDTES